MSQLTWVAPEQQKSEADGAVANFGGRQTRSTPRCSTRTRTQSWSGEKQSFSVVNIIVQQRGASWYCQGGGGPGSTSRPAGSS